MPQLTLQSFLVAHKPREMAQESILAYRELMDGGVLADQHKRILGLLRANPDGLTNNEISSLLGMRINSVSGRVNELRKMLCHDDSPLVVHTGTKVGEYGKLNAVWRLNQTY